MEPPSRKRTSAALASLPSVTKTHTSICCQDLLLWFGGSHSNMSNLTDKIWVTATGWRRTTGDASDGNDLEVLVGTNHWIVFQ